MLKNTHNSKEKKPDELTEDQLKALDQKIMFQEEKESAYKISVIITVVVFILFFLFIVFCIFIFNVLKEYFTHLN